VSIQRPIDLGDGYTLNLMCADMVIQNEINQCCTQKQIAQTYALALRSENHVDWKAINIAIINRWSVSGLERIKQLAWSGKAFDEPLSTGDPSG